MLTIVRSARFDSLASADTRETIEKAHAVREGYRFMPYNPDCNL